MTRQTSIDSFRYIRVLACFGIVILHSLFASNVYFEDTITAGQLFGSKTAEHLLMWPVPCFLMVTGALLLDPEREITLGKITGKYLRRILIALVVFTLIFQILDYMAGDQQTIISGWLANLFLGHSWAHMWYFYLLAGLYLMMPLYRIITKHAEDKLIWYLIGLILLFVSLIPLLEFAGIEIAFYIPTQVIYPVYLFMGYMLFKSLQEAYIGIGLAALSTAAIVMLCVYEYKVSAGADHVAMEVLYDYASPFVVAQSAGVFILFNKIKRPAGALLRSLDECSFGIYIIHMIGIRAIMKWWGYDPYTMPVMFIVMAVVLFFASYALVFPFKKVTAQLRRK